MDIFNLTNETETKVFEALKKVIDPEIGINIIDLGLVYKIEYKEPEEILVKMTLSTRGCPMGDAIIGNAESEIRNIFPDKKIAVDLVWEPVWKTDFVTEAGRKALGL